MSAVRNFLIAIATANLALSDTPDGHFSSWEKVPSLIDSISESNYREPLDALHQLTRIKLGYPQSNDEELEAYVLQTKQNWTDWWKTTGKHVSERKKQDARIDQAAFDTAWKFLGSTKKIPDVIQPLWIPNQWSLHLTFSNGDYGGREKELWIIERNAVDARLLKLRGAFGKDGWAVSLSEIEAFTAEQADQLLKAICYSHLYAPETKEDVPGNELPGLYYPHSTLRLRDGTGGMLWNTEGHSFSKNRPEYGDGESGRSYHFLKWIFPPEASWKQLTKPSSEPLAPFRTFLASSKPYFCSSAAEIVKLFGQHGGAMEKQALLKWAEKQKAATDPNMDWKILSHDFGTNLKVNVMSFTRLEIQETSAEIQRVGGRLRATGQDVDHSGEKELQQYITKMLALEKAEEEAEIERHPQPLRDLIRTDQHPDDPDLKHLSAAVQVIRNNPDPLLFEQLIKELHDANMRHLLNQILINEHDLLKLKPWDKKLELIAVGACIDSIPLAKDDSLEDLINVLLRVCGGGKIQFKRKNSGRSVEVKRTPNGYSVTYSQASDPLPIPAVQNELRRLYQKSREPLEP